jgi:hypothetical protein
MLSAVIVPSDTVDARNRRRQAGIQRQTGQTVDADTVDGYHATDIMAAVNQWPEWNHHRRRAALG